MAAAILERDRLPVLAAKHHHRLAEKEAAQRRARYFVRFRRDIPLVSEESARHAILPWQIYAAIIANPIAAGTSLRHSSISWKRRRLPWQRTSPSNRRGCGST